MLPDNRRTGHDLPQDSAGGRGAPAGRTAPERVRGPGVLTDRETEVLAQVGRGLSNDEITRALTISMGTVKSHIGSLRAKLHARDRAQLVIAAYDHGLVGGDRKVT